MTWARSRVAAALALLALPALAGCGGERDAEAEVPEPLAACRQLAEPPPEAAAPPPADRVAELPDLTLPCFTGGEPVSLRDVAGPAIINLWASWCRPCREELPVLQDYADRYADRVHVLGVVTADDRSRAAWFAHDTGVSFPALFDDDDELRAAAGVAGVPATLFVVDGQLRLLHQGELSEASLTRLADEHLGVP